MKKCVFPIVSGIFCLTVSSASFAAPINVVDYFSLSGSETVDFEDLPQVSAPGTNYDSPFVSGGVIFGESFVGQTVTHSGGFDQLSGTPTGMTLAVGNVNENINVFAGNYNGKYGNVLTGLGPAGFPDYNAIGEGSFAMLFSSDQSEFGFSLIGGNAGSAYIDFFARDGSVIDSITVSGLSDQYYGFSREGGVLDIAGLSIWNDDAGGIGIDDIIFNVASNYVDPDDPQAVPEPSMLVLFGAGIISLGFARRRKSKA